MDDDKVDVTEEEYEALKTAVRLQHERAVADRSVPQILRAFCVCGFESGPGTPACSALRKLQGG
jgi:hypothetical protein